MYFKESNTKKYGLKIYILNKNESNEDWITRIKNIYSKSIISWFWSMKDKCLILLGFVQFGCNIIPFCIVLCRNILASRFNS